MKLILLRLCQRWRNFGFVRRYEHEGEGYGYIPTWSKHQSINQREPGSMLPDPQRCIAMRPPRDAAIFPYYAMTRSDHAGVDHAASA